MNNFEIQVEDLEIHIIQKFNGRRALRYSRFNLNQPQVELNTLKLSIENEIQIIRDYVLQNDQISETALYSDPQQEFIHRQFQKCILSQLPLSTDLFQAFKSLRDHSFDGFNVFLYESTINLNNQENSCAQVVGKILKNPIIYIQENLPYYSQFKYIILYSTEQEILSADLAILNIYLFVEWKGELGELKLEEYSPNKFCPKQFLQEKREIGKNGILKSSDNCFENLYEWIKFVHTDLLKLETFFNNHLSVLQQDKNKSFDEKRMKLEKDIENLQSLLLNSEQSYIFLKSPNSPPSTPPQKDYIRKSIQSQSPRQRHPFIQQTKSAKRTQTSSPKKIVWKDFPSDNKNIQRHKFDLKKKEEEDKRNQQMTITLEGLKNIFETNKKEIQPMFSLSSIIEKTDFEDSNANQSIFTNNTFFGPDPIASVPNKVKIEEEKVIFEIITLYDVLELGNLESIDKMIQLEEQIVQMNIQNHQKILFLKNNLFPQKKQKKITRKKQLIDISIKQGIAQIIKLLQSNLVITFHIGLLTTNQANVCHYARNLIETIFSRYNISPLRRLKFLKKILNKYLDAIQGEIFKFIKKENEFNLNEANHNFLFTSVKYFFLDEIFYDYIENIFLLFEQFLEEKSGYILGIESPFELFELTCGFFFEIEHLKCMPSDVLFLFQFIINTFKMLWQGKKRVMKGLPTLGEKGINRKIEMNEFKKVEIDQFTNGVRKWVVLFYFNLIIFPHLKILFKKHSSAHSNPEKFQYIYKIFHETLKYISNQLQPHFQNNQNPQEAQLNITITHNIKSYIKAILNIKNYEQFDDMDNFNEEKYRQIDNLYVISIKDIIFLQKILKKYSLRTEAKDNSIVQQLAIQTDSIEFHRLQSSNECHLIDLNIIKEEVPKSQNQFEVKQFFTEDDKKRLKNTQNNVINIIINENLKTYEKHEKEKFTKQFKGAFIEEALTKKRENTLKLSKGFLSIEFLKELDRVFQIKNYLDAFISKTRAQCLIYENEIAEIRILIQELRRYEESLRKYKNQWQYFQYRKSHLEKTLHHLNKKIETSNVNKK